MSDPATQALIVSHKGEIVLESYGEEDSREDFVTSQSIAKAFYASLFGVAIKKGLIESLDEPIKNYLFTLPGFNKERKYKQVSQVFEQHGYIIMQLTRVFSALADTYGHIMRTKLAEVDLKDVVLNRRILVALLPALEKSPDELSNLGKIIIATMRTMMAAGLGEAVEGKYSDLVVKKPTNALAPHIA